MSAEPPKRRLDFSSEKFQRLQKEVDEQFAKRAEAAKKTTVRCDGFIATSNFRTRAAKIRIRNKKRTILIVSMDRSEGKMVDALLSSNPAAIPVFAADLEEGIELHEDHHFDMVYLVVNFRDGDDEGCLGPCFYSLTEESDWIFRRENPLLTKTAESVSKYFSGAEIMVVCGNDANPCPISRNAIKTSSGPDEDIGGVSRIFSV